MWSPQKLTFRFRNINKTVCAFYSRRSDSKSADSYKAVKPRKSIDGNDESMSITVTNFRNLRFHLPLTPECTMECVAQDCPMLLRRGVLEMFPGTEIGGSVLTVVTLLQKTAADLTNTGHEVETERERVTKFFVLAAQEVCMKLRLAGYWADFINPFSGRPYISPFPSAAFCETDETLNGLNFQINDNGNCKIISPECERSHSFVGSLFTTAPANAALLQDILNQYV